MRHEIFTLIFHLSLGRSTARLIYQECSLPMHIHRCICSLKNVLFENSTHAYNVFDQIHSCSLSPSSTLPLSCHHFFFSQLYVLKQTKTRIHLALLCMLVEEKCNLSSLTLRTHFLLRQWGMKAPPSALTILFLSELRQDSELCCRYFYVC